MADQLVSSARETGDAVGTAIRKRREHVDVESPMPTPALAERPTVVAVSPPAAGRGSALQVVPGLAKLAGRGVILAVRNAPLIAAGAAGAAASYLLDPENGRRRRTETAERLATMARHERERIARRAAQADVDGAAARAAAGDRTLTLKVEAEIFGNRQVPKGRILVHAAHGVVELRGVVERAEQIAELEGAARAIPGVVDVANLLQTEDGRGS